MGLKALVGIIGKLKGNLKLKALVFLSTCSPVPSPAQEIIEVYRYGIPPGPQSTLSIVSDGVCDKIIYDNEMAHSTSVVSKTMQGHYVMVINAHGEEPDELSVKPRVGYYVDGPDSIVVEEHQYGSITVCPEAMS